MSSEAGEKKTSEAMAALVAGQRIVASVGGHVYKNPRVVIEDGCAMLYDGKALMAMMSESAYRELVSSLDAENT